MDTTREQDGLQSFFEALTRAGETEQTALREATRRATEQASEDAKAQANEARDAYIARKKAALDEAYGEKRAGKTAGYHRLLAEKRTAIEDEVFDEAAKRIDAFTQTQAYPVRLEETLRRVMTRTGDSPLTVLLRPADLPLAKTLAARCGAFDAQADPAIRLGGFVAVCEEKRLRFDATYDTALAQKRQWFRENAGLTLTYEDINRENI